MSVPRKKVGKKKTRSRLRVAGLFAGIGGIEVGLHKSGHRTSLLCEIDDAACMVLKAQFPKVKLVRDIRDVQSDSLQKVDLVVAGFPCQDLSQAGRTAGIGGARSGLVSHVFRLLEAARPRWLLLENVSFMLSLDGGRAMTYLARSLEELGYGRWAYRVVNTRGFGLPQRRQRVLMLASQTEDPRDVLLSEDAGEPPIPPQTGLACGFYWTEGLKGLGWAVDAVPPLKGGSSVGIPSPPAICMPDGSLVTPEIRDAERLQGFPEDWTLPAVVGMTRKNTPRWKLVGNAVSVPVAEWIGARLLKPVGKYDPSRDLPLAKDRWSRAAWSVDGVAHKATVSEFPLRLPSKPLTEFLQHPTQLLSARATRGFLERARRSTLHFPEGFLDAVEAHLARMEIKKSA